MTSSQLVLTVSMAGFGIQQAMQVLADPYVTKFVREQTDAELSGGAIVSQKLYKGIFLDTEAKKYFLGRIAFVLGALVAWLGPIRILETLTFVSAKPGEGPSIFFQIMDVLITGFALGAGTEGANSVLKWVQYAKDSAGRIAGGSAPSVVVNQSPPNTSGTIIQSEAGRFSTLPLPGISFNPCHNPVVVLNPALVTLIFWGDSWLHNSTINGFAAVSGRDRLLQILDKAYLSKVSQYGVSEVPRISNVFVEGEAIPLNYTFETVIALIKDTIVQNALPVSQGSLFAVVLPRGMALPNNTAAFHSNLSIDDNGQVSTLPWPYMLVGHDGNLDTLSYMFSHELIEACTNPNGNGWRQLGNCPSSDWKEIVDVCPDTFAGRINGAKVSGYWSEEDHACIVPI